MQPLIMEGEKLQAYVRWGFDSIFRNDQGRQVFQVQMPSTRHLTRSQTHRTEFGTDRISVTAV